MTTWITDENGNRCSVEYWGSEEAAKRALASLENCRDCTNCSDCSDCSRCSDCSDCSRCSDCSDCSRCSDCSGCSRCSGCSDCSDCSDCSHCSDCSDCSRCSDCSDCSRCSDCSDCSRCSDCSGCSRCSDCSDCSDCSGCSRCSGCSDCSRCSDCSNVAFVFDKKNLKGDPASAQATLGQPPIPKIENIHQKVYEAASQPKGLDMSRWHTCGTTHCRAGWVVHLAGEAGYALERFHNTEQAARMIYEASDPHNPVHFGRFYETNEIALADMRRLAGVEAT